MKSRFDKKLFGVWFFIFYFSDYKKLNLPHKRELILSVMAPGIFLGWSLWRIHDHNIFRGTVF